MKRSEMIETIVYEALSWDGLDISDRLAYEIAEDMLRSVEKHGMLPPSYTRVLGADVDGAKSGEAVLVKNAWEPEDET